MVRLLTLVARGVRPVDSDEVALSYLDMVEVALPQRAANNNCFLREDAGFTDVKLPDLLPGSLAVLDRVGDEAYDRAVDLLVLSYLSVLSVIA